MPHHAPSPFVDNLAQAEVQVIRLGSIFRYVRSLGDLHSSDAICYSSDAILALLTDYVSPLHEWPSRRPHLFQSVGQNRLRLGSAFLEDKAC